MDLDPRRGFQFEVDFSVYVVLWISQRGGNLRLIRMDMPPRVMFEDDRDDRVFTGDYDRGVGNGPDTDLVP